MMQASNYAVIGEPSFNRAPVTDTRAADPTPERESHRFAKAVLRTLDLPDAHRAPIVIRELGLQSIDAMLAGGAGCSVEGPLAIELDNVRLALLHHVARLDELREEHAQRLRAVEVQIGALQRAICRVPVVSDGFGATPALSNAVERLGNLLVSQSILKRIGPQISLAQQSHESLITQIECALQAARAA